MEEDHTKAFTSLLEGAGMPKPIWWKESGIALMALRRMLTEKTNLAKPTQDIRRPWITILPLGNFACGLSSIDEEIECVAFGNIGKKLFPALTWDRIIEAQYTDSKRDPPYDITPFEVNQNRIVLRLQGFTFVVQYIECIELVNAYPNVVDVSRALQKMLPDSTNNVLFELQDLQRVQNRLDKTPEARLLFYFIKVWLTAVGLFGTGALGKAAVCDLFWKVLMKDTENLQSSSTSTGNAAPGAAITSKLQLFFTEHTECLNPHIEERCELGSELNISENCSKALHEEFSRLSYILEPEYAIRMLTRFHYSPLAYWMEPDEIVRVTLLISGNSESAGYYAVVSIENSFESLATSLQDVLKTEGYGNLSIRHLPRRLVEKSHGGKLSNVYEAFWLIGINGVIDDTMREALNNACEAWRNVVSVDLEAIQRSEAHLHASCFKDSITLENMVIDERNWQRPLVEPDPSLQLESLSTIDERQNENKHPSGTDLLGAEEGTTKKLRPAMDILNRLKWDYEKFKVDDYVVVYLDRQRGLLTKPVNDWATETTADDWIPQDRIKYFKRISDGILVWDRAAKIDLINA